MWIPRMMRRTSKRCAVYIVVGTALILAALGVHFYVRSTVGAGVRDHVQHQLGKVEYRAGIQAFTLYGPRQGEIQYADSICLSLEFRGVQEMRDDLPETKFREDRLKRPRLQGRYRVVVKDSDDVLLRSEGDLSRWCNWHLPWQGTVIDLDAGGTGFAKPVPNQPYTVEFEWLETPEETGEAFLWWSYVTTLDLGF